MSRRTLWMIAAAAVAVAAVNVFWFHDDPRPSAQASSPEAEEFVRPRRPSEPPVPGLDLPRRAPEPKMPPDVDRTAARAYAQAVEAGVDRPGDKAFRATVDAFVEYNMAFAEAQAKQEGLTVDEVRELTYLGFMVLETQRWPDVEELLGRALTEDERLAAESLMNETNAEFKETMRKLVAEGKGPDQRSELIRSTQERYKTEYFALTGMTPELLDDLLAGDASRKGAPITTPPPEDIPRNPAPVETAPRPRGDQPR